MIEQRLKGIGLIKSLPLASFLSAQLQKLNINLKIVSDLSNIANAKFIIVEVPPKSQTLPQFFNNKDIDLLKYAIVYSNSLKQKLSLLNHKFVGIFHFPVIIEEIAKVIKNHQILLNNKASLQLKQPVVSLDFAKEHELGLEIITTSRNNIFLLRYRNKLVNITPREKQLLEVLLKNGVYRKNELPLRLHLNYNTKIKTPSNLVSRLRTKLKRLNAPIRIQNLYGYGYFIKRND